MFAIDTWLGIRSRSRDSLPRQRKRFLRGNRDVLVVERRDFRSATHARQLLWPRRSLGIDRYQAPLPSRFDATVHLSVPQNCVVVRQAEACLSKLTWFLGLTGPGHAVGDVLGTVVVVSGVRRVGHLWACAGLIARD